MKPNSARYRLRTRNLEWGGDLQFASVGEMKAWSNISVPEGRLFVIKRAIDRYFLPNIGELLSRIAPFDLDPWHRTCGWAFERHLHEAVMRHPRALVPYIRDAVEIDDYGKEMLLAGESAECAESEFHRIKLYQGMDPGSLGLTTLLAKIAALSLFERTPWAMKFRPLIVREVCSSAELSYYLAAAISPTQDEWEALIDSIRGCPRASYATWRLPHLPYSAPGAKLRKALETGIKPSALFSWALQFIISRGEKSLLTKRLLSADASDSETCALSLAISPEHPRVAEWLSGLMDHPEMAYQARRLLSFSLQLDAEFLLAPKLGAIALKDPRWGFHWLRDFGEDTEQDALRLVPHMEWMAELIHGGIISPVHANAIDDQVSQKVDLDHWLRSSFLIYATKAESYEQNN